MNQQINLFQPMFRRERQPLSARVLLQVLSIVAGGLFCYVLLERVRIDGLRDELETANEQHLSAASHLESTATQLKPKPKSEELVHELAVVQAELAASRRAADAVANGSLGNVQGFSEYLVALARRHIQGTWITGLAIKAGGLSIAIKGHTLEPGLVADYLQALSAETSFSGKSFGHLKIDRSQDAQRDLEFQLSTTPPAESSEGARKHG